MTVHIYILRSDPNVLRSALHPNTKKIKI